MVLDGFLAPSWVGWISGNLFYRTPWGTPTFTSWSKEPFIFYHIPITALGAALWIDYISHYQETFSSENSTSIKTIITKVFTYFALIIFLFLRICFMLKAKLIVKYLGRLEYLYGVYGFRHKALSKFDKFTLWIALLLHIFAAAAFAIAVGAQRQRDLSWFSILTKVQYSIVFFVFGTFPISCASFLCFAYTLVVTKYLIGLFDDFCQSFCEIIDLSGSGIPEVKIIPPNSCPIPEFKVIKLGKLWNTTGVLQKYDDMAELTIMYDEAVGPFLLGLVITIIVYFVQTINAILILNLSFMFLIFDWLTLVYLIFQLVLILFNLGHSAHRGIHEKKMKIRRKLMNVLPTNCKKSQLMDIMALLNTWDWKMSAWGFFIIDRTLMPGVLSIMMSYVVILFQIQLNTDTF